MKLIKEIVFARNTDLSDLMKYVESNMHCWREFCGKCVNYDNLFFKLDGNGVLYVYVKE